MHFAVLALVLIGRYTCPHSSQAVRARHVGRQAEVFFGMVSILIEGLAHSGHVAIHARVEEAQNIGDALEFRLNLSDPMVDASLCLQVVCFVLSREAGAKKLIIQLA